MTYTQLLSVIGDWLHRDGVSQAATFVALAEARLNKEFRVAEMETRALTSAATEYIGLPGDFSAMRYMTGGDKRMNFVMPEKLIDMAAVGWTPSPPVYTITDAQIRICPAPTVASPLSIEMVYYANIPPLETAGTNWLLESHPDVYLQASMVEARQFVKAGTWQEWEARLQNSMLQLNQQSDYQKFGGPIAVSIG